MIGSDISVEKRIYQHELSFDRKLARTCQLLINRQCTHRQIFDPVEGRFRGCGRITGNPEVTPKVPYCRQSTQNPKTVQLSRASMSALACCRQPD
jgi:hypothetical protein